MCVVCILAGTDSHTPGADKLLRIFLRIEASMHVSKQRPGNTTTELKTLPRNAKTRTKTCKRARLTYDFHTLFRVGRRRVDGAHHYHVVLAKETARALHRLSTRTHHSGDTCFMAAAQAERGHTIQNRFSQTNTSMRAWDTHSEVLVWENRYFYCVESIQSHRTRSWCSSWEPVLLRADNQMCMAPGCDQTSGAGHHGPQVLEGKV